MMKRALFALALTCATLPALSLAADVKEPSLDGEINLPNYPAKGKAYAPSPADYAGAAVTPKNNGGKMSKRERQQEKHEARQQGRDLRPCLRHGKNKEVANCARFPNGQKDLHREPVGKHETHKGKDKVKAEKAGKPGKSTGVKASASTSNKRKHK